MKLSIVIPTLNSERTLPECLDAIIGQTFPRDQYEIVIADAGSSDSTLAIAREKGVDRSVELFGIHVEIQTFKRFVRAGHCYHKLNILLFIDFCF